MLTLVRLPSFRSRFEITEYLAAAVMEMNESEVRYDNYKIVKYFNALSTHKFGARLVVACQAYRLEHNQLSPRKASSAVRTSHKASIINSSLRNGHSLGLVKRRRLPGYGTVYPGRRGCYYRYKQNVVDER